MLRLLLLAASLASAAKTKDPLRAVDPFAVPVSTARLTAETVARVQDFDRLSPRVGERAPDFQLENLEGESISLTDYRGKKPVILVVGSASCNMFRHGYGRISKALEPYRERVALMVLYTLEAHPASGERCPYADGPWVPYQNIQEGFLPAQPRTARERADIAAAFAARSGIDPATILVDDMENETWRDYGSLTASVFVIGPDGRIAYKSERAGSRMSPDGLPLSVATARALVTRGSAR